MDSPVGQNAGAGLAEALRLDPTLAADPARLRRALADLAPYDERGTTLVALGAEVGVPALVARGEAAEAHARLVDLCGCRADAARWVVRAWAMAIGGDAVPESAGTQAREPARDEPARGEPGDGGQMPSHFPASAEEAPGAPTTLGIAVWPDAAPALAVITLDGAFVLGDAREQARGRWRRLAWPRTPLTRDIAIAADRESAQAVWSDHDGVHSRTLGRPESDRSGPVRLGADRLLASPASDQQVRYPLAALAVGLGSLVTFWTVDRREIVAVELRDWAGAVVPAALPPVCVGSERLACLDACKESDQTAWLACLSDRGRMSAARFDLSVNDCGQWLGLNPPAVLVAAAIACLRGAPIVIAATAAGDLLSLDVRDAASGREAWHSIDRPADLRQPGSAKLVGAAELWPSPGPRGAGWLALAGGGGAWVAPISRNGPVIECGEPIGVWLG